MDTDCSDTACGVIVQFLTCVYSMCSSYILYVLTIGTVIVFYSYTVLLSVHAVMYGVINDNTTTNNNN